VTAREEKSIVRSSKTREVVVRRICLIALAITASSLAVGLAVGTAGAKTHPKTTPTPKPVPIKLKLTCTVNETLVPPAGSDAVIPPVSSGNMYGGSSCGAPVGAGLASASQTLSDAGDLTGKWWHYGKTGSIVGAYDWTQSQSQPSNPLSFFSESYTGTLTVTKGTGAFKGATGTGTSACTTPDSVHFTCTEKIKLTLPPVVTAAGKGK
jgi:hypothetical protein